MQRLTLSTTSKLRIRALILWGLGLVLSSTSLSVHALPTFEEVKQDTVSSESMLLDRYGEPLQRLRSNMQERRGEWVSLQDISPALRTAMVLSEDKRFYQHSGVDWQAVGAAAWGNLWNNSTRGASTISMQLTGLINDALRRNKGSRSLWQKVGQALSASSLDGRWRKDEILEAYLNLVPYRGEIIGIDAISRTLFGKAPHGLNDSEAAIVAALVRAPNAQYKAVAHRACGVLANMRRQTRTSTLCDSVDLLASSVMQRRAWSPSDGISPHLAQRLLAKTPSGTQLRSTLVAPLQRFAVEQVNQHMRELSQRNAQDAALVVLDNATGDVLAWVGASASTSHAPAVDYVTRPRQTGSTLKPFLYAQAIAEKRLTAASLLDDSPAAIPTQSGLYIPQNYDRHFRGWVSVRAALGNSLNVPAVRTLGMVGTNAFALQLQRLGLALHRTGEYYGYSLALGSPEISLLQLTNAYRALANHGNYSDVRYLPTETAPVFSNVLDPRAVFITSQMLSDNNARQLTFGPNSMLHTRYWSAVKTGTSKDMRDNWAVGYSQRYTVGVWVGNANGAPMWDVSGTSGATPIWASIMNHLHSQTPSTPPEPIFQGMLQQPITWNIPQGAKALQEPERLEWFISGTEQAVFHLQAPSPQSNTSARIQSPSNGTIIAIDPDIPPQRQRVSMRTNAAHAQWWIDQQHIGQGTQAWWFPWPGKHTLQLRDPQGRVLDEVKLEVRGASVKQ